MKEPLQGLGPVDKPSRVRPCGSYHPDLTPVEDSWLWPLPFWWPFHFYKIVINIGLHQIQCTCEYRKPKEKTRLLIYESISQLTQQFFTFIHASLLQLKTTRSEGLWCVILQMRCSVMTLHINTHPKEDKMENKSLSGGYLHYENDLWMVQYVCRWDTRILDFRFKLQ